MTKFFCVAFLRSADRFFVIFFFIFCQLFLYFAIHACIWVIRAIELHMHFFERAGRPSPRKHKHTLRYQNRFVLSVSVSLLMPAHDVIKLVYIAVRLYIGEYNNRMAVHTHIWIYIYRTIRNILYNNNNRRGRTIAVYYPFFFFTRCYSCKNCIEQREVVVRETVCSSSSSSGSSSRMQNEEKERQKKRQKESGG